MIIIITMMITMEDMKEKAEGQLSDIRKAESSSRHNFEMLKQSLEDQIKRKRYVQYSKHDGSIIITTIIPYT